MVVKSQEIFLKKKDFFLNKVIVLYGENQDLINDLNDPNPAEKDRCGCGESFRV